MPLFANAHILGHNVSSVQQTARHVLSVLDIALDLGGELSVVIKFKKAKEVDFFGLPSGDYFRSMKS